MGKLPLAVMATWLLAGPAFAQAPQQQVIYGSCDGCSSNRCWSYANPSGESGPGRLGRICQFLIYCPETRGSCDDGSRPGGRPPLFAYFKPSKNCCYGGCGSSGCGAGCAAPCAAAPVCQTNDCSTGRDWFSFLRRREIVYVESCSAPCAGGGCAAGGSAGGGYAGAIRPVGGIVRKPCGCQAVPEVSSIPVLAPDQFRTRPACGSH